MSTSVSRIAAIYLAAITQKQVDLYEKLDSSGKKWKRAWWQVFEALTNNEPVSPLSKRVALSALKEDMTADMSPDMVAALQDVAELLKI